MQIVSDVQTKRIRVMCERPEINVEIDLGPKDTAEDVVRKAGQQPSDYAVMRPDNESRFNAGEVVWDYIRKDGDKLHLVPISSVGSLQEMFDKVVELMKGASNRPSSSFAEINGWRRAGITARGQKYEGYFWCRNHRWSGEAIKRIDGYVDIYIWHPPMNSIRNSKYSPCFHATGTPNRWSVGIRDGSGVHVRDLNAAVAAVNQMLHEVFAIKAA